MSDKQLYQQYLTAKKKSSTYIKDAMEVHGYFHEMVKEGNVQEVADFVARLQGWMSGYTPKAFQFLAEYPVFIEKENPKLKPVADAIQDYCIQEFKKRAQNVAEKVKNEMRPIPDNTKIKPVYLKGMISNSQFVDAFKTLQECIIKAYDDIKKQPFAWGYPNVHMTEGYYNRLNDILFAFALRGAYKDGVITVDTQKFFADTKVKKHKKIDLIIAGLEKMGFSFEGFDKRNKSFRVLYPVNPQVLYVLYVYAGNIDESLQTWQYPRQFNNYSYRYVEDPATQSHESVFHAVMDIASDKLREIQYWLHADAEKCGYRIDVNKGMGEWAVYKKGSKEFLCVGEKQVNGKSIIATKAIFRTVFETEKEKIHALATRFPKTFTSNSNCPENKKGCLIKCIRYEIDDVPRRNCPYSSFWFEDISLDDVKDILELYKIENKIKMLCS